MEDPSLSILLLVVLLLLSGFFSGAEIALFSLSGEKIRAAKRNLKEKSQHKIKRLENLKKSPQKLLVTILICNNVVNVASSSIATLLAQNIASNYGIAEQSTSIIAIVVGVMTFLILMFGEITPKALAHKHALSFSLFCAPIIQFFKILLYPIVLPLTLVTKQFTGSAVLKHGLSEEELHAAVELSEAEGTIKQDERELVEKALEFDEHFVEDVMTPRSQTKMLASNTTIQEVIHFISTEKFSRIPIYDAGNFESIIGILTVHTLVQALANNISMETPIADINLSKPFKVPPTMKISTLKKTFQKERTSHMALVYDEHGGFIGLITMEDILEEIFGEILDENDTKTFHIRKTALNTFDLDSDVELEHIEQALNQHMHNPPEDYPWETKDENNSLKYYLIEQLEKFPQKGEMVRVATPYYEFLFRIEALEPENQTITKVRLKVKKLTHQTAETTDDDSETDVLATS